MLLMEFDKAGAEWVVVAYLCGDARMIEVVESGKSPHVVTGMYMTGASEELVLKENKLVDKATDPDEITKLRLPIADRLKAECTILLPRSMSIRQAGKKSNHGLNYRETYKMFALINEITETEARPMVEAYSKIVYPGIVDYWKWIDEVMQTSRTLVNCFGRKVTLLDEYSNELKKAATSFIPQSTVVDMVNRAMKAAYKDTSPTFRAADLLTQTHDSVTWQYSVRNWTAMADFAIRMGLEYMSPEVSYNFRPFRIKTDLKVGKDWGHMVEVRLTDNAQELARRLQGAWEELNAEKVGELA